MPSFKKYGPSFSSQPDSSQKNDSHRVIKACSLFPGEKRGRRGTRTQVRTILRVRLANVTAREDTTGLKPPATKSNRPEDQEREKQSPTTEPASVDRSIFFFSQESSARVTNEKEMTKSAVLRTITRMLEENELIRQRLTLLTQANQM